MGNVSLCTFAMQQVSLLISLIVLSSLHTYAYRYVSRICLSPLIRSKIRLLDSDPVSFEVATSSQCESGCGSKEKGSERSTLFLVDVTSDPTAEELSNQNLIRIVNLETSDEQTNELCWKCLGYRFNPISGEYNNDKVFPKWRQSYPTPPDVIGVTRSYDPVVDKPVRDASMALMRSIPRDFKGGVRNLEKDGFRGFKLSELTPNKTRRAQVVNWLIYYREKLFGRSLDDLRRERDIERNNLSTSSPARDSELNTANGSPQDGSNNLSVTVDPNLPSERMFRQHRLDDV